MTHWRNLLVFMTLPTLAMAADPEMMKLVMPDAKTVMEINLARIMASPLGDAMREGARQGLAGELNGEMAKAKPEFQAQMALLSSIDWSQQVQDILVARGSGKQPPTLIIVRSSLGLAQMQALKAFSGNATAYEGVPMLESSKPEEGAVAFLDGIVVLGQMNDVKAAIHRRGQPAVLPAALAAQVAQYNQDDVWMASTEVLAVPSIPPSAASAPAGAQMIGQFVQKVAGLNGGLRFSPDFDLSADVEARTEKGAGELAQGMRLLTGMAQSQARSLGQGLHGLEGFKFQLAGKHIRLSLHVPQEQMRAGLQQIRAAQASQAAAAQHVRPANGPSRPPAGTIRVESSEGTELIPVGKQQ